MQIIKAALAAVLLCSLPLSAQQTAPVKIETTVSGNQEQPKTIYVLPWQSPVSVIRIPGQPLLPQIPALSPLDRQQFLRFIAVQASTVQTHSVNAEKQQ